MIETKYIELINYEIDGVITPEQKSLLDKYLKNNLEAETLRSQLIATNNRIAEIPEMEPSANLKKQIMNSIDPTKYSTKSKTEWITNLNIDWVFHPKSKLAFAFVLGMFMTLLFLTPFWLQDIQDTQRDDINFLGTMGLDKINELKALKKIDLDLMNTQGMIQFKKFEQFFILDLNINCDDQTELVFEYDPTHLHLIDINPVSTNQTIKIENSFIKISNANFIESLLLFSSESTESKSLNLKVFQAGSLDYNQKIDLKSTAKIN
jgi:hypothetical protein